MGVWIETKAVSPRYRRLRVTPFVGVWIETKSSLNLRYPFQSHPSWVCGLKLRKEATHPQQIPVTPFVGVWIETQTAVIETHEQYVTPFVGVWIETQKAA